MIRAIALLMIALPAFAGREFVTSSSEMAAKTAAVSTYPLTISAWFNTYSTNANQAIAGLFQSDARRFLVYYTPARNVVADSIANGGSSPSAATSTTTAATNAWHNVVAVFDSDTSRRIYLNGTGAATNTTATTASGMTTVAVGARNSSGTWGLYFNGVIAEVAVWSAALSDGEIASLATKASPMLVRPALRVHYFPMVGGDSSSEIDLQGTQLGLTNTPAQSSNHPPIYKP